jgi:hypothetical protein
MLSVIKGQQGSGKSCYCTDCIKQDLERSKRPVFTNLPIHPDRIVDTIAKTPVHALELLNQIYIFHDTSVRALRRLKKTNPRFYDEFRGYKVKNKFYERDLELYQNYLADVEYNENKKRNDPRRDVVFAEKPTRMIRKDCHIISTENVKEFWNFVKRGAIIYIDEAYEHLGNENSTSKDPEVLRIRRQMRSYMRQHRHQKHDMFLISHSTTDFDKHIRKAVMETIHVSNSKYEGVFPPNSKMGSLFPIKWPCQFFIIRKYRGFYDGDESIHDYKGAGAKEFLKPNDAMFALYDSFSDSHVLGDSKDDDDSVDFVSRDTEELTFWGNVKKALYEARFMIILFVSCIVGILFLISGYSSLMASTQNPNAISVGEYQKQVLNKEKEVKKQPAKSSKETVIPPQKIESVPEKKVKTDKKKKPEKLVFQTSEKAVFESGLIITKGQTFNEKVIQKITRLGFYLDDSTFVTYSTL